MLENLDTALTGDAPLALPSGDKLLEWQLRVAQRADVIAKGEAAGPERDREYWRRAEELVFAEAPDVAAPAARA